MKNAYTTTYLKKEDVGLLSEKYFETKSSFVICIHNKIMILHLNIKCQVVGHEVCVLVEVCLCVLVKVLQADYLYRTVLLSRLRSNFSYPVQPWSKLGVGVAYLLTGSSWEGLYPSKWLEPKLTAQQLDHISGDVIIGPLMVTL